MDVQRGNVVKQKLSEMNPFVKVEFNPQKHMGAEQLNETNGYSAMVYGFRSFEEAIQMNEVARQNGNVPFYCLNSSGLQGFFYADLGTTMTFKHTNPESKIEQEHIIYNSKTMQAYFNQFLDHTQKFAWTRRDIVKPHKFLLLSIVAQYLKEKEQIYESFDDLWQRLCQLIRDKNINDKMCTNQEFWEFFK